MEHGGHLRTGGAALGGKFAAHLLHGDNVQVCQHACHIHNAVLADHSAHGALDALVLIEGEDEGMYSRKKSPFI